MTPDTKNNPRALFFDGIAEQWDGWEDLDALAVRLAAGLEELGVGPDESVLDVGCGTGNLTRALLERLSPAGRVLAVDISPRMLDAARRKIDDSRVSWRCEDAACLSAAAASLDRVICCSAWPHFPDPRAVAAEFRRVLRPGGRLHVWHLISRQQVNAIHAGAGEAVRRDVLPPAAETAALLAESGFAAAAVRDDDRGYLVNARREA